jgi:hypothetical protein
MSQAVTDISRTCLCGILRTYYATYVYYCTSPHVLSSSRKLILCSDTYDITWYAYYGWIWTSLEASLGLICASAPALKLFFTRYFSTPGSRIGYSTTGSRKTPMGISQPHGRSGGQSTVLSSRTHVTAGAGYTNDIPMDNFNIKQKQEIHVEYRDDMSQKSDASTRILTAPGENSWREPPEWTQGYHANSTNLGSPVGDKDIEKGI